MPVKWTTDKDSFILNHLLTSPAIKVNNELIDGMIEAWPEAFGDKPTRKAFTEHFSKVRKANKSHIPASTATGGGGALNTPIATPRKQKGTGAAKAKTPASKRKRGKTSEGSEDETDTPPISRAETAELGIKDEGAETPSKKPRRASPKVKYEESEAEEHPSDLDEYNDAEVV